MLWQWIDSLRAFISRTCGASRGSAVGLELIVVVDNGGLFSCPVALLCKVFLFLERLVNGHGVGVFCFFCLLILPVLS
uniref:Uncharacterized protein n=1 Tax=Physcomitrium patens TaxID=3218 RepID=A0A7I3Z042_PHYPA